MARRSLADPELRPLIERLTLLAMQAGSVNRLQQSLTDTLASDKSEGWIYPNRLHTLLSEDPTKGISSATVATLELALSRLPSVEIEEARRAAGGVRAAAVRAWAEVDLQSDGEIDALWAVAERVSTPPAVARWLLQDAGLLVTVGPGVRSAPRSPRSDEAAPDWSFQDDAFRCCLTALRRDPNRKVGLVLPTGGGKTRVAIRIMLGVLADAERDDAIALWVTHRTRLKTQAHRELQRAITDGTPDLPDNAVTLLARRVDVCMISDLRARLDELGDRIALVVVDEAHHAAAPSYQPIFDRRPLRGLFLTATPNRSDLLPIGIDEIAYTTTYRDLFRRGVVIEPDLDELTIDGFAWDREDRVRDLADYLLQRASEEFAKTLVVTSRIDHAVLLHEALVSQLDDWDGHVLSEADIAWIHGSGSSTGELPQAFLDEFQTWPRGLLVATAQLLGEGFDDPAVDAVVITYPTGSLLQLMQAAGRCMRYSSGKKRAYVVQVKDSPLAYHWEQRWLYQDISDVLRPRLEDHAVSSYEDLAHQIERILAQRNVREEVAAAVRADLAHVDVEQGCSLLLTGLPYEESSEQFEHRAEWGAILVTQDTRDIFLRVFNDFSARDANVQDFETFLRNYLPSSSTPRTTWQRYIDMLWSMNYAHRELTGEEYSGRESRPPTDKGTTWLRYVTFAYTPVLSRELEEFLKDAVNRDEVAAAYVDTRSRWGLAIKLPLPLAGTLAFLLDHDQSEWFIREVEALRDAVQRAEPRQAFFAVAKWRLELGSAPLPQILIERLELFLSEQQRAEFSLPLGDAGRELSRVVGGAEDSGTAS